MSKGDRIKEMLREGKKYGEITRETGAAASTIAYHAKREGLRQWTFERKIHDWPAMQAYYDEGHTLKEIEEKFGADASTIYDATKRGAFRKEKCATTRQASLKATRKLRNDLRETPNEAMFVEDSVVSTKNVKRRILRDGLKEYSCSNKKCLLYGIIDPIWASEPIVLHLDHENGVRTDHRLNNLRFLCPNCHSQTETYCGKNIDKRAGRR